MSEIRVEMDPALIDMIARGTDKPGLLRLLKKVVPRESRATLTAAIERAPVSKGQLQASIGITNKTDARRGEVYAVVGVKDNATVLVNGMKTLFTSARKMRNAVKLAAKAGASQVSSATAFKYVRGIESGYKSKGHPGWKNAGLVGRAAGGAHMFQGAADQTGAAWIETVGESALKFVLDGSVA